MQTYANVHLALEQMRVRALRAVHGSPPSSDDEGSSNANPDPPRVLILGPANSGKTTVSKILINYAVRTGQEWTPMLVNTDPGEVNLYSLRSCPLLTRATDICRVVGQHRER